MNREHKRLQIITLKKEGLPVGEIAEKTGTHRRTVQRVWKRYLENGHFKDRPRIGRPVTLTPRGKRIILYVLKKNKSKTATAITKKLKSDYGIMISRRTVSNILHSFGYVALLKKKKPRLTEAHKKARYHWAKKYSNLTVDEWKDVIWTDETKFNVLNSDGKEYYWTNKPSILTNESVKPTLKFGGGSIIIWGCITWKGVGFSCKIEGNMDAELYYQILRDELVQTFNYYNLDINQIIFQHDNDPKHTSKIAKAALEELGIKVMSWPSQSPGLNPIEHYWNHFKRIIREKTITITSKEKLWQVLENELKDKNKGLCQQLISSMPRRVKAVLDNKGGYTKY